MMYLGDFPADQAIYFMWNTNDSSGGSITRAADGTLSVYKDNSDGTSFDQTQVTTGITNDEDVDGLTGVHSCCITTTNAWYETGHDYVVVLSASTIDGETVIDMGCTLAADSQGKGFAVEGLTALLNFGFSEAGYERITAHHMMAHHAARALVEKLDFTLVRETVAESATCESAKVLLWDGTGLCLYQKRLERGRFASLWRRGEQETFEMTLSELALFLEGSTLAGAFRLSPPPTSPQVLTPFLHETQRR